MITAKEAKEATRYQNIDEFLDECIAHKIKAACNRGDNYVVVDTKDIPHRLLHPTAKRLQELGYTTRTDLDSRQIPPRTLISIYWD